MSKYATQPVREGYTNYSATLEAFEKSFRDDLGELDDAALDKAFEFETQDDAIADAAMIASNTKQKVLILQKVKMTNASFKGIGWVYPDGEFCAGI